MFIEMDFHRERGMVNVNRIVSVYETRKFDGKYVEQFIVGADVYFGAVTDDNVPDSCVIESFDTDAESHNEYQRLRLKLDIGNADKTFEPRSTPVDSIKSRMIRELGKVHPESMNEVDLYELLTLRMHITGEYYTDNFVHVLMEEGVIEYANDDETNFDLRLSDKAYEFMSGKGDSALNLYKQFVSK